jgi:phosphodiester glycosidase
VAVHATPIRPSWTPGGPAPEFVVDTGGLRYFGVQVATEAFLLSGAGATRRTPRNFFDSSAGDGRWPAALRFRPEVAAERLEAEPGPVNWALPAVVWRRLTLVTHLYYRAYASARADLARPTFSVPDVDWARAPATSIGTLPAYPARSAVARFRGKGPMSKPNFLDLARAQLGAGGMVAGRDGDFHFCVLDARRFDMTVVECHDWGLTDTVEKMPRKPDAVINAQFIASPVGIASEGEVIREGRLINADSKPTREYIAQAWGATSAAGFEVGQGDPSTDATDPRAAFGGLGPVLRGGAPVSPLNAFAKSIYDRDARVGRGVIGVDRDRELVLLVVQEHSSLFPTNAMTMPDLRDRLRTMGVDDAVFVDGSDSVALFAGSGWSLTPGLAKDESMDFAVGFVDRQRNRRARVLAIDGTKTADGKSFIDGTERAPTIHYMVRNLAADLKSLTSLAPIAGAFRDGVLQAWRATNAAEAALVGGILSQAGAGGQFADLLYVSSHAWRHGQLWYHRNDDEAQPLLMLADPWSPSFRPVWRTTPEWLILAGCAVLGLRYSRGRELDATERAHIVDWHRDMHGASAIVPGLTTAKKQIFAVYHPGWAWYTRVFAGSSSLRGVLGYWYRSPSAGRDVEIITDFAARLREGRPILEAWAESNRRGWLEAEAAWAAMVREGCTDDRLATLEAAGLPAATGPFRYHDRFQTGRLVPDAYEYANRLTGSAQIGSVPVTHNAEYDKLAVGELKALPGPVDPATFLAYVDGIGP